MPPGKRTPQQVATGSSEHHGRSAAGQMNNFARETNRMRDWLKALSPDAQVDVFIESTETSYTLTFTKL